MTTPKLREGAEDIIECQSFYSCKHLQDCDRQAGVCQHWTAPEVYCYEMGFETGAKWALSNLHNLLEPRDMPIINGKRVAIVEVEGEK